MCVCPTEGLVLLSSPPAAEWALMSVPGMGPARHGLGYGQGTTGSVREARPEPPGEVAGAGLGGHQ